MSMSRGCALVERQPGVWYCMVAMDEYDYDFHGNYSVYGPADTEDEAYDEMHSHECNPGSSNTYTHDRMPEWIVKLIDLELARQEKPRSPWY